MTDPADHQARMREIEARLEAGHYYTRDDDVRADAEADARYLLDRVRALEAERDALREAVEWAIDEGGWRLIYYARALPRAIDGDDMHAARVRTAEEIAALPAPETVETQG